jgi:glycosyltransferase involved in cell wall biosynthesis
MSVAKGYPVDALLHRGLLLLERLTLLSADAVITVNESYRDVAIRRVGIANETITTVRSGPRRTWPHGIIARPSLKLGRRNLVVFVGEMGSQDGVENLLESIRHYGSNYPREVLFALIGGGPEQQRMKTLAASLGLDDWILFTGRVTNDRLLREYIATADVCVAPDPLTEYSDLSTANKLIEYLAFGRPVVAFDLKEHRRTAGEAAVYVTPCDTAEFSSAVHALLNNPTRSRHIGNAGKTRFDSQLAWECSETRLLTLYRSLLSPEGHDCSAAASNNSATPRQIL